MRIIMILFLSLCMGLLSAMLPIAGAVLPVLSGILFLLGILFLIFLRKKELRLMLIFFGLSLGVFLGWRYDTFVAEPALKYAGQTLTVTAEATSYSKETAYGIQVDAKLFLEDTTASATVWLYSEEPLKPGDHFTASLRLVDSNQDESYYSYSEGIFLLGYGKKDAVINPCESVPLKYFPKVIAHRLEGSLENVFPEDTLGFAVALTTGNRSGLSDISKANMKASGIYHALALSGMHLAVLLEMVGFLLFKRKRPKAIFGIPVCIFFTIITGCAASMVRASVMQCLLLSAYLFRRERDFPTSLFMALGILMMENPWCILNWGLQLSFLSVIGIELFCHRILTFLLGQRKIKNKRLRKLRRGIFSSVAVSLSAMVMTMPLMALYFGFISLISPLTNILTGTVISICFGGSLITALIGLIFPPAAKILAWILSWGFRYVNLIAGTMAKVPFAQLYTRTFYGVIWLILLYFMIFLIARKNSRKIIPICCMLSSLAVCTFFIVLEGLTPAITALDVGQGQCLLLQSGGGSTVMVDCGGNNGNAGDVAADHLSSVGETDLDLLILTHYDEDHVGGVTELMQRIHVEKIAMPDIDHSRRDEITAMALRTKTEIYFIRTDTEAEFGQGTIEIFAPLDYEESNESGLSILAQTGDLTILITGDMEADSEKKLLSQKDIPDIDILIAGHHGSKNSTCEALLEQTRPECVIISVGDNSYGHPTTEAIERITAIGADILRTDLSGTITIRGDP